jgi:L,D-peptidoglycan transpeptidase YkuD (ErfK/YbiS/YcfS/YnhG family)
VTVVTVPEKIAGVVVVVVGVVVAGAVVGGAVLVDDVFVGAGVVVAVVVVRATVAGAVADRTDVVHAATATQANTVATKGRAEPANTATYATDLMPPSPPARFAPLALVALVAVAAACGGSSHPTATPAPSTTRVTLRTTTTAPTTSTVSAPPTTAATTTTVPPTTPPTAPPTVPPTSPPPTAAPPASPLLVTRLNGVGNAGQVIAVSASGYGRSTATFTAYQRTATGWQQVFGPWLADLGRNGFAPPGAKREGDGRTPSGSYGFSFFFGENANPGVKFEYRAIPGPWIVWDDDPSSPNYNEWIDDRVASAGVGPEPMHVSAYAYGAVIAYNAARTPGLGSAIFLHVSDGGSTAGCVSLPVSELVSVLRWLDPARAPRIVMGTGSAITG